MSSIPDERPSTCVIGDALSRKKKLYSLLDHLCIDSRCQDRMNKGSHSLGNIVQPLRQGSFGVSSLTDQANFLL